MTDRWTQGAKIPPPKYTRVIVPAREDGLVHLSTHWIVFGTEFQPGKSIHPGVIGTAREAYDETLCGYSSEKNGRYPRTTDAPTCVACVAMWVSRPDAVLEDP